MNEIDIVVDVRQSPDTPELIVLKQKLAFSGEASLVGGPVETRVGLMTRKARVSVFAFAEVGMGNGLVLAAKVKNIGTVPFEISRVAFEHRFEQPQPLQVGRVTTQEIGGGLDLVPRNKNKIGPFQPGEERDYYLPPVMFDGAALIGTSLSPTQFWIAAYSGSEEVGRVGGEYIRPYLDRSRIVFHRRALPLFETLPESDRLAIIKAVAPFRGMERDQWPSRGAHKIEGVSLAFAIRAGEDFAVLMTQTEDKGVEIVDIIRKDALDQFSKSSKGQKQ